MPAWLMSAVRTAVQTGWGCAAAWMMSLGVSVPAEAPAWLSGLVVALVTLAVTAVIRWLETRPVSAPLGRLARLVARLVMLGITRQPTGYAAVR